MYLKINHCDKFYGIRIFLKEDRETQLNKVFLESSGLLLLPENISIPLSEDEQVDIKELGDGSILELSPKGAYIYFNTDSFDNTLFITNRCNSSCIMCPTSELMRKTSGVEPPEKLMAVLRAIPNRRNHITITGGEPFLLGEDIFQIFEFMKMRLNRLDYLLLTNGRAFAIEKYFKKFCESAPSRLMVGIPIHGSNSKLHDAITRAEGSFEQTVLGIKRLLKADIKIELRIVVSKLNIDDIYHLSQFILENFRGIYKVTFVGLEMLGSARKNMEDVWIDYRESFDKIKNAIDNLIYHGVNVQLYNYPLCCVDSKYWSICQKSISVEKIVHTKQCEQCDVKDACCGMFKGTYKLLEKSIKAVRC